MISLVVALALSGAAMANALGSGSVQVSTLRTGGTLDLEASEILGVSHRHLASEDSEHRVRGMDERRERHTRRERGTDRRDLRTERRERGGERRKRRGRGSPPVDEDIDHLPVQRGPMPSPGPARGPAGSLMPGPTRGPGPAPGPAAPPMPGPMPSPQLAPESAGPVAGPIAPVAGPIAPVSGPIAPVAGPIATVAAVDPSSDAVAPTPLQTGVVVPGPAGPLSAADLNVDGQVTLAELTEFLNAPDHHYRAIGHTAFFIENDTNEDGVLTPDELAVMYPPDAFDGTDTDGDGSVSYEEAEAFSHVEGHTYRSMGLLAFFHEVDTNDDDIVDQDEIAAAHASGLLAWY